VATYVAGLETVDAARRMVSSQNRTCRDARDSELSSTNISSLSTLCTTRRGGWQPGDYTLQATLMVVEKAAALLQDAGNVVQ
jgi:hypothetical protein